MERLSLEILSLCYDGADGIKTAIIDNVMYEIVDIMDNYCTTISSTYDSDIVYQYKNFVITKTGIHDRNNNTSIPYTHDNNNRLLIVQDEQVMINTTTIPGIGVSDSGLTWTIIPSQLPTNYSYSTYSRSYGQKVACGKYLCVEKKLNGTYHIHPYIPVFTNKKKNLKLTNEQIQNNISLYKLEQTYTKEQIIQLINECKTHELSTILTYLAGCV